MTLAFSCKKNEKVNPLENKNLEITSDLPSLSDIIGISSITDKNQINSLEKTYQLFGVKKILNNYFVNLDSAFLKIKNIKDGIVLELQINNQISKSKLVFKINSLTKNIIDLDNYEMVNQSYLDNELNHVKALVIMSLYQEISRPNSNKINASFKSEEFSPNLAAGCDRTLATLSDTRSGAIDGLKTSVDNFLTKNKDCVRVYGIDSGCLWGDYLCVATQAIRCSGTGCNVPFGTL